MNMCFEAVTLVIIRKVETEEQARAGSNRGCALLPSLLQEMFRERYPRNPQHSSAHLLRVGKEQKLKADVPVCRMSPFVH